MAYGVVGTFRVVEGGRDELVARLLEAASLLSDDPACRRYVVGTAGNHEVCVFELWDDPDAHDASLRREDIRAIIDAARPLITDIGSQIHLDVRGGKGV